MKFNKLVCLDGELIEFLKKVNASELINRLVKQHMDKEDLGLMSQKQLQTELNCNELERETKKKLQEMRKNAK